MSEDLKCPICGKPTAHIYGNYNKYGLCIEHSKQEKAGQIEQCPDCGKWHHIFEKCECKKKKVSTEENTENVCIICGKSSNGKPQCIDCYHETRNHIDSLDKNKTIRQLRDYCL